MPEISSPVTIYVAGLEMSGRFRKMTYETGHTALMLVDVESSEVGPDEEVLSINLAEYYPGLPDGFIWVKDYSDWAGTADSIAETGLLAKRGRPYKYGPYDAQAQMMEVLF